MNNNRMTMGFAMAALVSLGLLGVVVFLGYLLFNRAKMLWGGRPVETRMVLVSANGAQKTLWSRPLIHKK